MLLELVFLGWLGFHVNSKIICSISLLGRSLEFLLWMGVTLNVSSAWLMTEGDLELVLPLNMCLVVSARLHLLKRKGISLEGPLGLSL